MEGTPDPHARDRALWLPHPDLAVALDIARGRAAADPWWPSATLELGHVALELNDPHESTAAFRRVAQANLAHLDTRLGLMLAGMSTGVTDVTPDLTLKVRRARWRVAVRPYLDPRRSQGLDSSLGGCIWRVLAFRRLRAPRRALAAARDATIRHSGRWQAWEALATAAEDRRHWDVACAALRRSAVLRAPDEAGVIRLVRLLLRLGRADEAARLGWSHVSDDASVDLLCSVGDAEGDRNNWPASLNAYGRARDLAPAVTPVAVGMTRAHLQLGEYEEARAVVTSALAADPYEAELLWIGGAVALAEHDLEMARTMFATARRQVPEDTDHDEWLTIHMKLGLIPPFKGLARRARQLAWRKYGMWNSRARNLDKLVDDKADLTRGLRPKIDDVMWKSSLIGGLSELLVEVLVALGLALVVLAIVLARTVFGYGEGLSVFASLMLGVAQLVCAAGLLMLIIGAGRLLVSLKAWVGLVVLLMLVSGALVARLGDTPPWVVLLGVGALSCMSLLLSWLIVSVLFTNAVDSLLQTALRRHEPRALAVAELLWLWGHIGELKDRRGDLRSGATALERAASALNTTLRELQSSGDPQTDAWLGERAAGCAAAMRGLKAWVLSPGPESLEALSARVASDIRIIVTQEWREMPWQDPGLVAARRRRILGIAMVRNVGIALLPLAVLLVIESTNVLALSPVARGQALLASIVWSIVALLMTLDPDFTARMAAAKESIATFRQGTKN